MAVPAASSRAGVAGAVATPVGVLTPAQAALMPSNALPVGLQLSHLVSEFTTLALSLFAALSAAAPLPTAAIYDALAAVDAQLAALLPLVAEHQRRERRVQALVDTLRAQEQAWQDGAHTLHSAIAALAPVVASGKLDRAAIAASAAHSDHLTPATILSYARLLAPFTSAPPSSLYPPDQKLALGSIDPSGRGLPVGAIPPFPTEGAMRRGRLQFGRTDEGGMGETTEVGVRKDKKDTEVRKPDPGEQLQLQAKQMEVAADDGFDFQLDLDL